MIATPHGACSQSELGLADHHADLRIINKLAEVLNVHFLLSKRLENFLFLLGASRSWYDGRRHFDLICVSRMTSVAKRVLK